MEKRGDLSNENVLILTSKMGLGTYIPALHLRGALVKRKVTCYVDIIENYFSLEQNEEFAKNKRKFHENMRFAKIGHRLAASRFNNLLSQEQMEKLSKRWIDKNISSIVILSGNWLPMAEFYYQNNPKCILWAVHMDVGVTPSWNKHNNSNCPMRIVNVFDSNNINCLISPEYFLPDTNSDCNKVFVHGGGWGMGNYKDAVDELLRKTQYSILTTIYEEQEICDHERCENYLLEKEYVTENGKKVCLSTAREN